MYESNDNMVSNPQHYMSENGIECIDAIKAAVQDFESYCTGNIIKYIWRWKKKNGVQDLEKAEWYLTCLINHIKSKQTDFIKEN